MVKPYGNHNEGLRSFWYETPGDLLGNVLQVVGSKVVSLSLATGALQWEKSIEGVLTLEEDLFNPDNVLVKVDGTLIYLNKRTGTITNIVSTLGDVSSLLVQVAPDMFVTKSSTRIYCYKHGELEWQFATTLNPIRGFVNEGEQKIYLHSATELQCYSFSGSQIWNSPLSLDVSGSFLTLSDGNLAFVHGMNGDYDLSVISPLDGELLYRLARPPESLGPVNSALQDVHNKDIFYASRRPLSGFQNRVTVCYNASVNIVLWEAPISTSNTDFHWLSQTSTSLLVRTGQMLRSLSKVDGTLEWEVDTGQPIVANRFFTLVFNDVIYSGASDYILRINPLDGSHNTIASGIPFYSYPFGVQDEPVPSILTGFRLAPRNQNLGRLNLVSGEFIWEEFLGEYPYPLLGKTLFI